MKFIVKYLFLFTCNGAGITSHGWGAVMFSQTPERDGFPLCLAATVCLTMVPASSLSRVFLNSNVKLSWLHFYYISSASLYG